MKQQLKISVYEIVGSNICMASDDGEKVYKQIASALRSGVKVILSFRNVDTLITAFLNAAIGQLYSEFPESYIRENLEVSDMDQDDLALLKRVVETAKAYFKNPGRFNRARKEALEEDDE
ncbi:MAG: STAS-like domain-containing protein [Candidatus Hatepunaea meridiana]|nr:STAS-like domain-containing protein [Candidatus Hatepunaea meridiana]